MQGLNNGDFWSAIGCHSCDINFQNYIFSMKNIISHTLIPYKGNIPFFLKNIFKKHKISTNIINTLMIIALSAFFDPNKKNPEKLRLPFNIYTGEIIKKRWGYH